MDIKAFKNILGHVSVWMLFAMGIVFHGDISNLLQANSISQLKHDPIQSFVYPYQKTVDWASNLELTSVPYNNLTEDVFIDPVKYAPNLLGGLDNMNSLSNLEINSRLTYSVPYMGNYKYDGKEYAGSHPGVDIKLPHGSPIVAIANGIVTKVKVSEVGFGNHVVIRHNNVNVNNQGLKETIYSTYGHLSDILVNPGDVLIKGQVFALSGNSGLSTGAHLNFQIEKDTAKWHPYWPFSDTEIMAAGLNFISGINQKYGFEDAVTHTLNPLVFIDEYNSNMNSSIVAIQDLNHEEQKTESQDILELEPESIVEKITEPIQKYLVASIESDIQIDTELPELPLANVKIKDQISIHTDEQISFVSENVKIWVPSLMRIGKEYELNLKSDNLDFMESDVELMFNKPVQILDKYVEQDLISYKLKPLVLGTVSVEAMLEGSITSALYFDVVSFNDLSAQTEIYQEIKLLSSLGFINGDKNHNLALDKEVTAAEALKILILLLEYQGFEANQKYTQSNFSSNDWFNAYVDAALAFGIFENRTLFDADEIVTLDQLLAWYYKATDKYVTPNIKRHLARYVRSFGSNKLFVQQALIDGVVTTNNLKSSSITRKDLFKIIYHLLISK